MNTGVIGEGAIVIDDDQCGKVEKLRSREGSVRRTNEDI